jgi:hypothetical protein
VRECETREEFMKKLETGIGKLRKQTKRIPKKDWTFLSRNDDTVADDDFP